jgi:hypothetical protein
MPTVPNSGDMCGTGCTGDLRCLSKRTTILKTKHQRLEVLKKEKNPHGIFIPHYITIQCLFSLNIIAVTLK